MERTIWATRIGTLAACAVGAVVFFGCDKPQARKAVVLNPTTRQSPNPAPTIVPVVPVAATQTAATQAAKKVSHMQIGRMLAEFPEARLMVRKEGDKLSAFLVSNDPPEVLNPNYRGNRFYFEMALDGVGDIKNIAQADFVYKAGSAEAQDTPNGIFLDGDRQHLQPYDIRVVFDQGRGQRKCYLGSDERGLCYRRAQPPSNQAEIIPVPSENPIGGCFAAGNRIGS